MKDDPRVKNKIFSSESIGDYLNDYSHELHKAIESVDLDQLNLAFDELNQFYSLDRQIFSIGNGGSHAISDHLSCDFVKGAYKDEAKRLKVIPLGSLTSLHSAAANDFGHDNAFLQQLRFLANSDSLLIAISSSGNSKNILNAVNYHKSKGGICIGMSGFDGGKLKEESDISLHVHSSNYGIIEDAHQALMHILAQYLFIK